MDTQNYFLDYFRKKKDIQENLLNYLENDDSQIEDFITFISYLDNKCMKEDKYELKVFLRLLADIAGYHYQNPHFIEKIESILKNFEKEIKNYYSNFDIFMIFNQNKRILYFLFKEQIIVPDETLFSIITNNDYYNKYYPQYFYPEFKTFYNEELIEKIQKECPEVINEPELFEKKRQIGQNDNIVCQLIRNDSIKEFIIYYTKNNFSKFTTIKKSIYETNNYLLNETPSLLEYSAFFGSIEIFQFLYYNDADLISKLWTYTIHGNNAEMIHILEENQLEPPKESYINILESSVRCHHINIMRYIENNFNIKEFTTLKYIYQSMDRSNFIYLFDHELTDINDFNALFYYCCEYDYFNLVKYLINNPSIDINKQYIFFN